MNQLATRRARVRLRRAIERGDPRLGFFVGAAVTGLVALAFAAGVLDRFDLFALDLAFLGRRPIAESERILFVYMDDNTERHLGWPIERMRYGQAAWALDRLGAAQIVFDVVFKKRPLEQDAYDPVTGAHRLTEGERLLRSAIERSGRVILGYRLEFDDQVPPEARERFAKLREVFAKAPSAGAAEAARESGLPEALLQKHLEIVRREALAELVAERLREKPQTSFSELRAAFLPDFDPGKHQADLHALRDAYWLERGRRVLREKSTVPELRWRPPGARAARGALPPFFPFLEKAAGVGITDIAEDPDGIKRRPWAYVFEGDRVHAYLGLEAGLRLREGASPVTLRPGSLDVGFRLPVDDEGRILVDWAGNRTRRRGGAELPFAQIPFVTAVNFFNERYRTIDANVRTLIGNTVTEDAALQARYREYVDLSDRLAPVLVGQSEMAPEESKRIEDRMDAIRREILEGLEGELRHAEVLLAQTPSDEQRARFRRQQYRDRVLEQIRPLREFEDMERALRGLVQGRVCFIGSSSTAIGDLHPTPLGPAIPGVDIHGNVANMVLTRRGIWEVPRWVNLVYMLALGVAVAYAVAHLGTGGSSVAAAVAILLAVGAYAGFFSSSILVAGAGPLASVVASFVSVTLFKEMVTRRSKRKLQQELEKNTSPALVKILMEHPEFLAKPRRMEGTFFFSDFKSFSSISEQMAPEVLFPFVNLYLDAMTRALKANRAYVDKYIGDAVMGLFGIPVPSPDHARDACRAALQCLAAVERLNAELARSGHPALKVRIGLHSGAAFAGYVGASDRAAYTVLGDAVNLAARLEGANKPYGTSILISEATHALVQGEFVVRELDRIRVVGKRVPVRIFELVSPAGAPGPYLEGFLQRYERAYAHFGERRWREAAEEFERALELRPEDPPARLYRERAREFLAAPPPPDWDGVFDLQAK